MIKPPQHSYPMRIVVKFGRVFHMCDHGGQTFVWFIEVLRVCLSSIEGPLELFYSPSSGCIFHGWSWGNNGENFSLSYAICSYARISLLLSYCSIVPQRGGLSHSCS